MLFVAPMPSLRLSILAAALALALVATTSRASAEAEAEAGADIVEHWDATVGAFGGRTSVEPRAHGSPTSGLLAGLSGAIAYYPQPDFGVAIDVALMTGAPRECPADASCFNHVAESQQALTIGPRWRPHPVLFLQAAGGVTLSSNEYSDVYTRRWWSPTAMFSSGLAFLIDPVRIGLEGRASALRNSDATVTNLALALTVGMEW